MLATRLDHWLTRRADARRAPTGAIATRSVPTPAGHLRVHDGGGNGPCVLLAPDGPNVLEHLAPLLERLRPHARVIAIDMPGFGFSRPAATYGHRLDEGADALLAVLDACGVERAVFALSCANGFYGLRAARRAPGRVRALVLAQTPSLPAMRRWVDRVIPRLLRVPLLGQAAAFATRRRAAHGWYRAALPRDADPAPWRRIARYAFDHGGCFCLAGVVQGLDGADDRDLDGVVVPVTVAWGALDRSHRHTAPDALREAVPHARIVAFDECGHFPDLERPDRFADLVLEALRASA